MSEDDLQRLPFWFGDPQYDTLSAIQWIQFVEKTRGMIQDTVRKNHYIAHKPFLNN
jgi:hypothetical protein